jgi:hypothetical protein
MAVLACCCVSRPVVRAGGSRRPIPASGGR